MDRVTDWDYFSSFFTLFFGFSRLMRSRPIPVSTYFMEPSKLSRTAGCEYTKNIIYLFT